MSYSGGKQQAPLLQQPSYQPIYPPQGYSYDKSEGVAGPMPDGRAAAMNPAGGGRYPQQPGAPHMYGRAGPAVDGNAAAAYQQQQQHQQQQQQHQQQQQQQQMRSQGGGMPYGGRGSGGGRAPQAFGGMPVPPPGGAPHYLAGAQQGSQPGFLVLNVNQQQAVMQNPAYMPTAVQIPYQVQTGYMPPRPQGPAGYAQPQVWGQQQPGPGQMYQMPPQQHPPRAMPAMAPSAPAPQQPAQPSRASKRIAIINPNTGEEVSARAEPAASSAGEKSTDTAAGQTGGRGGAVAAEFAKMVAQAATSRSRTTSEAAEPLPPPSPAAEQMNGAVSTPPGAGPPPPAPAETPPEPPAPAPAPVPVPAAAPAPVPVPVAAPVPVSVPAAAPAPVPVPAATAAAPAAPASAVAAAAAAPAAPAVAVAAAPTPAPAAPAPAQPPAPVEEEGRSNSQKKTKAKQKMRELNRRAEGKEGGGDMDAFVDTKPAPAPTPAQERPPLPPSAAPAPAPSAVATPATKPATAAAAVAAPPPAAKPAPAAAAATPASKPAAAAAKQTPPATSAPAPAQKQTPAAATPPAAKQAPAATPAPASAPAQKPTPAPAPAKQTAPAAAATPAAKPAQDAVPEPAAKQVTDSKPPAKAEPVAPVAKPTPEAASKPAPTTAPAPVPNKAAEPTPAPKKAAEPAPAAAPKPAAEPAPTPKPAPVEKAPEKPAEKPAADAAPVAKPAAVPTKAPSAVPEAASAAAAQKAAPAAVKAPPAAPVKASPPPQEPSAPVKESTPSPALSETKPTPTPTPAAAAAENRPTAPADKPEKEAPPAEKQAAPATKPAEEPVKPSVEPAKPAAPAPVSGEAAAKPSEPDDDELEEGEIRDDEDETPVVNGDAAQEEEPPQKTAWQLHLERMKEESIRIGEKMKVEQKKQYNRDDLMKLLYHPLSQKRPDQLPDLPSIVRRRDQTQADQARAFAAIKSRSMGPMTGMQDYGGGFKPLPNKGYRGGRGSQQGRRDMPPPQQGPRTIQISLNRDVKLKESENAWKAGFKAAPGDVDEDVKVIKAFKGILNKITPNNIERLTVEIKKLKLDTEHRLHEMIQTLFDKAVDEPMYADQYATICVSMSKTEATGSDGNVVNFRKLLLTQCQKEFEKDKTSELNRDERQKEIDAEKDEEKKKKMEFDLRQESVKIRRRSNGNIRFIGELYKLGMLTDRIMHQCIVKLVKDKHEDSYECLCKLMTTIGQKLEKAERARGKDLSSMFNDFSRLSVDKSLASRIRFMLQDLIDMRNNNWVNTRTVGQAKPMTIEEVRKQARQQEAEQQVMLAQAEDRRRNERGPDRRGPGGGRPSGGGRDGGRGSQGGADGWNTVSKGRFDASRMLNAIGSGASQMEAGALKMGPGGGSSWSFGSKVGSGRRSGPAAPSQPEVRTTANMFGMLQEDGGGSTMPPMPPMRPGGGGGRAGPTRGSTGREGAKPAAPAGPALKGSPDVDEEQMQGMVRLICEEYIDAKDYKSSIQDIEEKLHADTIAKFVGACLNKYVDARSTEQRHLIGELHRNMLESGHIQSDAYLAGSKDLLEFASDLACDIPSLWANLGELLAPPLTASRGVTLEALAVPAAGIVADRYGAKFVTSVLKRLTSLHGADKVRSLVPASFDWKLYFGEEDHVQTLVNSQLGFLVAGANVPLSPEEAPSSKGVRSLLRKVQTESNMEAWVKNNVPEKDRASAAFIKDLVCALCFSCIVIDNGAKRVLLPSLDKHGSLLKCLIVSEELELAALYGMLALVRHLQHPPGVLDKCFRQLYDMEVISESAYLRWRDDKNPAEQEGMGVALSGLQAFFKALEEAGAGDDDDRT